MQRVHDASAQQARFAFVHATMHGSRMASSCRKGNIDLWLAS